MWVSKKKFHNLEARIRDLEGAVRLETTTLKSWSFDRWLHTAYMNTPLKLVVKRLLDHLGCLLYTSPSPRDRS